MLELGDITEGDISDFIDLPEAHICAFLIRIQRSTIGKCTANAVRAEQSISEVVLQRANIPSGVLRQSGSSEARGAERFALNRIL